MATYFLRIDDELWKQIKLKCVQDEISLKALIESRLKAWLAGQK